MQKVCPMLVRKKVLLDLSKFANAGIKFVSKFGGIQNLTKLELRTFVMAVFQHKTFCRFDDITKVQLSDILQHLDYFSVRICCSKTEPKGNLCMSLSRPQE